MTLFDFKLLTIQSRFALFMLGTIAIKWIESFQTGNNEALAESSVEDFNAIISLLYNNTNKELDAVKNQENRPRSSSIPPTKHYYNNNHDNKEKLHQTQKATLSDVLMMKLVSYYEDKYKIADHEPTERTKHPVLSENDILDNEHKDALKIGFGFKHFKNPTNLMDVQEVVIA